MNQLNFNTYINLLRSLNRATKNGIKAPHKPVLLISIIQLINEGEIFNNQIYISPELVLRFKENFKSLVKEDFFAANFSLPFYHLQSEKFWHLRLITGKQLKLTGSNSIRSFSHLKEVIAFAYFDTALFILLQNRVTREAIYKLLTEKYFPDAQYYTVSNKIEANIAAEILYLEPYQYKNIIEDTSDEDIFIRCGVFKKVIPKSYNFSCCITGLQIFSPYNIQMVDACHIIPFAVSHDDTIGNGLSMSPTLHRAFDRGLVAIDDNYKVIVSPKIEERSPIRVIKNLEGINIDLPIKESYYPSLKNLHWHRNNIFRT